MPPLSAIPLLRLVRVIDCLQFMSMLLATAALRRRLSFSSKPGGLPIKSSSSSSSSPRQVLSPNLLNVQGPLQRGVVVPPSSCAAATFFHRPTTAGPSL